MSPDPGVFKCPRCGKTYSYNWDKMEKYWTEDKRLKCKIPECDYILSEDESFKITGELVIKKASKNPEY